MKKKPSEIFEGPDSSLHRTWKEATSGEMLMFNQFLESAESVGFTVDQSSFLWYWIEAISKKDV
jgi:hypothetical protein